MSTLSLPLLNQLNDFVCTHMGLNFVPQRTDDLRRGIISAAREFGFEEVGTFINWLLSSPMTREQIEILASHLTVGETYFFREPQSFRVFEEQVLPQLIEARSGREQRLRIWSAGCCTGEEPYSLAISLTRALPDLKNWDVTILATDINPHFLRRASQGVYGEWSFRDIPAAIKTRYFTPRQPGRYEIADHIKRLVTFAYLNLAEDTYPSLVNNTNAMDVIFCRNVLIYLEPRKAQQLIHKLDRCLVDGGWLFVGATEVSHTLSSNLVTVNFPGAIIYRKRSRDSQVAQNEPSLLPIALAYTPEPPSKPPEEAPPVSVPCEPIDSKTLAQLARSHADRGELSEALEWCEKAIQADKLDPCLYYLRGAVLQECGQSAMAAASFKKALYLDPDFVMAHFALGYLAHRQGEYTAAGRHFDHTMRLLPNYRPHEPLPESEGITAGRLAEIIASITELEMAT